MEHLLDFLNNRNITINTISGAKEANEIILGDLEGRKKHVAGVMAHMGRVLTLLEISAEIKDKLMQIATLHDIGYGNKINFSKFHPYDGYVYLKANDWDEDICKVVMFHSYAKEMVNIYRPDLMNLYTKEEFNLTWEQRLMIDIITYVDLLTSSTGEVVSFGERMKDVESRFGTSSVQYRHFQIIAPEFNELVDVFNKLLITEPILNF